MAKKRPASDAPQDPKAALPASPTGVTAEKAANPVAPVGKPASEIVAAPQKSEPVEKTERVSVSAKPEPTTAAPSPKQPEQFGARIVLPEAVEKLVEASKPSVSTVSEREKPETSKANAVEPPEAVPEPKQPAPEKTEVASKPASVTSTGPSVDSQPKKTMSASGITQGLAAPTSVPAQTTHSKPALEKSLPIEVKPVAAANPAS